MRAARLQVNPDTGRAKVGIIVTGEVIEENGRLLGYITPWFTPPLPPRDDPRRRTFNLELIETGWAAFFPIYPSLPRDNDLNLALQAAESAWQNRLGAWAEFGENLLLGYEYRACLNSATPTPTTNPPSRQPPGSPQPSAASASTSAPDRSSARTDTTRLTRPTGSGCGNRTSPKHANNSACTRIDLSDTHRWLRLMVGKEPPGAGEQDQCITGLTLKDPSALDQH